MQPRAFIRRHSRHWLDAYARQATVLSVLAFCASLVVVFGAVGYATDSVSNPVTDIVLSNIRVFDVDGLFIYGMFLLIGFVVLLSIAHPKRIPFTLYSLALFYIIRAFFISLTHIAPYPVTISPDFGTTITKFFFGGDLFFSGHTGGPFLLALIYWREKVLRYLFIAFSVFFAVIVLLGHLHYSIDVFAAFFITYTIYHLALYFFPRARALFVMDDPQESDPV